MRKAGQLHPTVHYDLYEQGEPADDDMVDDANLVFFLPI